jgi:hypothetical protein
LKERGLLLHFGKMRGLNALENVGELVILGRPMPSNAQVLAQARAYTGKPIPTSLALPKWDSNGNLYYPMCDDMQTALQAIVSTELVQAIARLRGIRRTAYNAVNIWLFCGDVKLPMEMAGEVEWSRICPGVVARMVVEGEVCHTPRLALATLPVDDRTRVSVEAMKKRLDREGLRARPMMEQRVVRFWVPQARGTNPRLALLGVAAPGLSRWWGVEFRVMGRGSGSQFALVREDQVDGFQGWVEGVMGARVTKFRKELVKWDEEEGLLEFVDENGLRLVPVMESMGGKAGMLQVLRSLG